MGIESQKIVDVADIMVAAVESGVGQTGNLDLFAGTSNGVYCSIDFGYTWFAVETGQRGPAPVLALAVSPHYGSDGTLFAGSMDGLWQSTDGAATWTHVLGGDAINALLLLPNGADSFDVLVGTDNDGVIRSEDAGHSWKSGNPGLLELSILALEAVTDSDLGQIVVAGTKSGIYRSANRGKSWRPVDLPVGSVGVQSLETIWSRTSSPTILAGTEADGIFRSTDVGLSWEAVRGIGEAGVTAIASLPGADDHWHVVCATSERLAISYDCGVTWQPCGCLPDPALVIHVLDDGSALCILVGMATKGVMSLHYDGRNCMPRPTCRRARSRHDRDVDHP